MVKAFSEDLTQISKQLGKAIEVAERRRCFRRYVYWHANISR